MEAQASPPAGGGEIPDHARAPVQELVRVLNALGEATTGELAAHLERASAKVKVLLSLGARAGLLHEVRDSRGHHPTWRPGPVPAPKPPEAPTEAEDPLPPPLPSRPATTKEHLLSHARHLLKANGVDTSDLTERDLVEIALTRTILFMAKPKATWIAAPVDGPEGRTYIATDNPEQDYEFTVRFIEGERLIREDVDSYTCARKVLGTMIAGSVMDGTMSGGTYLDQHQVLHQPCWRLRDDDDLPPQFVGEVDDYLRAWGDQAYELICDWILALQDLSMPCPLLAITGSASSGKGLFASAAAALFDHNGVFTTGQTAIGNFNDSLGRSPIVRCDEGIPLDKETRRPLSTERLRDLVERRITEINGKHEKVRPLLGCLRWIVTANRRDFYRITGQTHDDVTAVLRRIVYIESPYGTDEPEEKWDRVSIPARYLQQIGGAPTTKSWTTGPQLAARHFKWILQNRKELRHPDPEHRFAMAPHLGAFGDWFRKHATSPIAAVFAGAR